MGTRAHPFVSRTPQSVLRRSFSILLPTPSSRFPFLPRYSDTELPLPGYRLMVRTLVFHTNNVGSIPASLSISINQYTALRPQLFPTSRTSRPAIRYSFRFVSLVPLSSNSSIEDRSARISTVSQGRTRIRKSLLMLSWLHYLLSDGGTKVGSSPSVAILPSRRSFYTVTRAPMAHKTSSKEQFEFYFYNFKVSFTVPVSQARTAPSVTAGAHLTALTKLTFPVFESNVLFLKTYKVCYPVSGSHFLTHLS